MKHFTLALGLAAVLLFAAPASAQVVINPAPVPACTAGQTLVYSGTTWGCSTAGSGTTTGSGTTGTIAKWTSGTALGNSIITESGATASVAGTWSVTQLLLRGSTSGTLTVKCPATCGSVTLTLPAGTTDFSATGGTGQVLRQSSTGAAFTVATLASTDLSDAASLVSVTAANVFTSATGQSMKKLLLPGSTSGTLTVLAAAVAGSSTLTLPGGTTDLSATGGTGKVLRQSSAGAAITVATLASTELSDTTALAYLASTNAFTDATDASSSTTGAIKTAGGLGVAKKLYVGTTLSVGTTSSFTGSATFAAQSIESYLTASQAVFTDGSKGLVSNAITGTGNVVMSASPTFTGTIVAANINGSGAINTGAGSHLALNGSGGDTYFVETAGVALDVNVDGVQQLRLYPTSSGFTYYNAAGTTSVFNVTPAGAVTVTGLMNMGGTLTLADAVLGLNIADSVNAHNFIAMKATTNGTGGSFVIFENAAGSVTGKIYQDTTSSTAYNTTSDQRLKNDLGLAADTFVLRNTKVHDFAWKSSGERSRGVFAQEAVLVNPEAVSVGTDELTDDGSLKNPWGVDYSRYVPYLLGGWQDHEARLAAIEAKLAVASAPRSDAAAGAAAQKRADAKVEMAKRAQALRDCEAINRKLKPGQSPAVCKAA